MNDDLDCEVYLRAVGWRQGTESLLESLSTPTANLGTSAIYEAYMQHLARRYGAGATAEHFFNSQPKESNPMSNEHTNLSTKDANLASAMYGRSIGGYVGVTVDPSSLGCRVFLAPASLNIKEEDLVVTSIHHGSYLSRVAEVDPDFVIPIESDVRYKWIVQKIDTTEYDAINAAVDAPAERITKKRTEASVEQAMAALGLSDDDVAGVIANAGQKALTNGSDE